MSPSPVCYPVLPTSQQSPLSPRSLPSPSLTSPVNKAPVAVKYSFSFVFFIVYGEDDDLVKQHLPDDFFTEANGTFTEMRGSNSLEDSHVVENLKSESADHLDLVVGGGFWLHKDPKKGTRD
ncbi:hypothetical protein PIB30_075521 [Stylosanthes scabra]|uniref:Uncharacterized protein n=1 Tax=Stylosanthes scabra TaxID=79078 RepID=A0ABU6YRS2_9FABA|nr:hypothetical protein [Stylosanthes scabra]